MLCHNQIMTSSTAPQIALHLFCESSEQFCIKKDICSVQDLPWPCQRVKLPAARRPPLFRHALNDLLAIESRLCKPATGMKRNLWDTAESREGYSKSVSAAPALQFEFPGFKVKLGHDDDQAAEMLQNPKRKIDLADLEDLVRNLLTRFKKGLVCR